MTINTMRKIDHYAGVPLCFLSTYILKLFPKKSQTPKKVLLIELSEMGSAILADPMMEDLKAKGCELYFLIFKKNKISLNLLNTLKKENIFTIDPSSFTTLTKDVFGFLRWARKNEIDSVIDLELFSRFSALLSGFSGASNVVGFYRFTDEGLYRGEMLTKKVAYNPHIHISKNFYSLSHALLSSEDELPFAKIKIKDSDIKLKKALISEETTKSVRKKIEEACDVSMKKKSIILVNANASDLLPQRRWSQDRFVEVIKMILDKSQKAVVLLTGAPAEREGLQYIVKRVDDKRCVNFAGNVGFLELPALYKESLFMLTNDSGPAHFAAVTDMPTFVIFGPETPALYSSLGKTYPIYAGLNCSPCVSAANHRNTPCTDNRCLEVISAKAVYETIKEKIGEF